MTDNRGPDQQRPQPGDAAELPPDPQAPASEATGADHSELLDDVLDIAEAGAAAPEQTAPTRPAQKHRAAVEPEPEQTPETPPIPQVDVVDLLPAVVIAGLLVYLFRANLSWLFQTWRLDEYYTHGFLIPLISAYIIYRQAGSLAALPKTGHVWSIVVLAPTICLHFAATYLDVNFAVSFALIGWLVGLTWLLWGWPVLTRLLFPLAFLGFMVPLGKLLIDQVSQPMQVLGARMAGISAQMLGMRLEIDGVSLETPDYTFEVAEACSGLKSAIAMLALGALLAYLVKAPTWKRLLIFASSLPVAILANAVRIWLTVMLGTALGHEAAEGFFHTASGMLVFVLAFLGLIGVTVLLRCRRLRDDI
ncbi:MAG TPA: hypothetical protein DGT21_13840 [Armatimonadetes bacterium]|jgi:exosortase|nr:hypothetical protein [Armatimonadota bacterium]